MERMNHMEYLEGMEEIQSNMMEIILHRRDQYDYNIYSKEDVLEALSHEYRTPEDFAALLSPKAEAMIEEIAQAAQRETKKHFGNSIYLFTPLYLSNYCDNHCIYCGFHSHNNIRRSKLDIEGIEKEMKAIAATGLEEILLLTGESRKMADVSYIGDACRIARTYFKMVGLEVYPLNTDEYAYLRECGADYITVFQETYDSDLYETLHLAGHKRSFPYRMYAQERALMGGMRGVAFASLLGLGDCRKDAFATGMHAYEIQKKYPHAEISFSCPRLRPATNNQMICKNEINETQLLQIICAYRLFMPYAGITISTRERALFRDHVIGMAATKISAGVRTDIGGHDKKKEEQGENQFEIADDRSVDEIYEVIKRRGLQPVMNDYVYV